MKAELSDSRKYEEKYTACCEELNLLKENYTKAASLNRSFYCFSISCNKFMRICDQSTNEDLLSFMIIQLNFCSELTDKLEGLKEEVEMLRVHNETLKSQHER